MPEYSFDEENHVHMLDGKKIKGCTTILDVIAKPALIPWAAGEVVKHIEQKCPYATVDEYGDDFYLVSKEELKKAKSAHRKKKEKAADWGTIVHKAIEIWIKTRSIPPAVVSKGENYILSPDYLSAINNFVAWSLNNNVEFILSEKRIYSEEWGIGGIVDLVLKKEGKVYVGDVKTSSGIYETYFLQTAAYAKMLLEMGEVNHIDGLIIVNCKKDGTIDVEERKDVQGNIKCYEAAIVLHNRLN